MQRWMGVFFFFFFSVFVFSVTAAAQRAEPTLQDKINARIKFHGGMDAAAYAEIGAYYYYGLEGFPEDKQEAYFWYNACRHEGEGQMSMADGFRYLEETFDQAARQFGREKMSGVHMMAKVLVEPGVRMACIDVVDYMNKYLPQYNNKAAQERIAAWKKAHPLPVDVRTPEQKKQAELKYRFLTAISGIGTQVDPVGIKALIDAGADVFAKTLEHQKSVLSVLVLRKDAEVVALVLQAHRFDAAEMQESLKTAYLSGDRDMARVLIQYGAVPDRNLYTLGLQGAMEQGDQAQVEYFLSKGARVDLAAFDKQGPAGKLIAKGDNEMLALYLKLLPATEGRARHINALFVSAAEQGNVEAMQMLLKEGAIINPEHGEEPLVKAVRAKRDESVDFLLKNGATLDVNNGGRARLMEEAFYAKNQTTVDLLVQAGIPLTADQQALQAQCKFRKEICPDDGRVIYGGAPKCEEKLCRTLLRNQDKLEKIVDHPTNQKNAAAVDILRNGKGQAVEDIIQEITTAPEFYSPATLGAMSKRLFAQYRDDEGIFWHMAAELRSNGDREVCKTSKYRFGDREMRRSHVFDFLKRRRMEDVLGMIPKVIDWDRQTPYSYNMQWGFYETTCLPSEEQAKKREGERRIYKPYNMPEVSPVEAAWMNRMEDMLEKAEKGDVEAQYNLGFCYAYIHRCHRPLKEMMEIQEHMVLQEKERKRSRATSGTNEAERKILKDFDKLDAMNARKWLQKAADNGHPHAARVLSDIKLRSPYTSEEKAAAYDAALQRFKQGEVHAYRDLVRYENPAHEVDSNVINYLDFRMQGKIGGKEQSGRADSIYKKFSEEERKRVDAILEEHIKKYVPLYNTMPKTTGDIAK